MKTTAPIFILSSILFGVGFTEPDLFTILVGLAGMIYSCAYELIGVNECEKQRQ